jgi:hypothetical protein
MGQKHATFNDNGVPVAFYSTEVHGELNAPGCMIPDNAEAITTGDWKKYISGNYYQSKGACTLIPAPVESLEDTKSAAYQRINIARLKVVDGGVEWNGYIWDSDETSRNNLTGSISGFQAGLFAADPETGIVITWRTADNQDIELTAVELLGMAGAMLNHVNTQYQRSWVLKQQINAATTVEAVAAIIWT